MTQAPVPPGTADDKPVSGPLSGIRVVDFTGNMAGPYGTMILADQGADVIKIEPPEGDVVRRIGPGRNGTSVYFANLNRGKRSVQLDLRDPASADRVAALIDGADVVVHAFRPDAARKFGLSADEVRGSRPRIIHVTIEGYGSAGPYAGRPVYDHVVQALSGIAARQATPRNPEPSLVRHGIVDKVAGLFLAQSVAAALHDRHRTGEGAAVSISMLDVAMHFLWPDGMMSHTALDEVVPAPDIANSFRLVKTADGHIAMVAATASQYRRLVESLGLDVGLDASASLRAWMRHAPDILRAASVRIATMRTAEIVDRLATVDVPCAPVVQLEALHEHPQIRANGVLAETDHPQLGRLRQPVGIPRAFGTGRSPSPALGQHTAEVLAELDSARPQTA